MKLFGIPYDKHLHIYAGLLLSSVGFPLGLIVGYLASWTPSTTILSGFLIGSLFGAIGGIYKEYKDKKYGTGTYDPDDAAFTAVFATIFSAYLSGLFWIGTILCRI